MKKFAFASLIALFVAPAMAAETYIGAGLGRAHQKLGSDSFASSSNSTSSNVFGGYQFDNGFGVEVGYTYFGKTLITGGGVEASVKPEAFYAAVTGQVALVENLSGFVKLGIARPGTTGQVVQSAFSETLDTRRTTLMGGLGVSYSLSKVVGVYTEYQYYGKAIKEEGGYLKLGQLSLGLRYHF